MHRRTYIIRAFGARDRYRMDGVLGSVYSKRGYWIYWSARINWTYRGYWPAGSRFNGRLYRSYRIYRPNRPAGTSRGR